MVRSNYIIVEETVEGRVRGSDGVHETSLDDTTKGVKGEGVKESEEAFEGNDRGMLLDTSRGSGGFGGLGDIQDWKSKGGTRVEGIYWRLHVM